MHEVIGQYTFRRRVLSPQSMDDLPYVEKVSPIVPVTFKRDSDVVLITGDAWCLFDDMTEFERMGVVHDLFCVNRSLVAMQRPVAHWAAIDTEEGVWLSQYLTGDLVPQTGLMRHTIGYCPGAFNCWWQVDDRPDGMEFMLWAGSTTYFAILVALYMGYKRVVLAGAPLDNGCHWYEPKGTKGPAWKGKVYQTWMDFARTQPARNVRSMSGYTEFMLGKPDEGWLNGC